MEVYSKIENPIKFDGVYCHDLGTIVIRLSRHKS